MKIINVILSQWISAEETRYQSLADLLRGDKYFSNYFSKHLQWEFRRYLSHQLTHLRRQSWTGDLHVVTEEIEEESEANNEEDCETNDGDHKENVSDDNEELELASDDEIEQAKYSELELYFLTL